MPKAMLLDTNPWTKGLEISEKQTHICNELFLTIWFFKAGSLLLAICQDGLRVMLWTATKGMLVGIGRRTLEGKTMHVY